MIVFNWIVLFLSIFSTVKCNTDTKIQEHETSTPHALQASFDLANKTRTSRLVKRGLGLSALAVAGITKVGALVLSGVIGKSVNDLLQDNSLVVDASYSGGGCFWTECGDRCPSNYQTEMSSRSNTHLNGFGGVCVISPKNFCCRSNSQDKTWRGRWVNSKTADIMVCEYIAQTAFDLYSIANNSNLNATVLFNDEKSAGRCGTLICTESFQKTISRIYGTHCNELLLFSRPTTVYPGMMEERVTKTRYYKSHSQGEHLTVGSENRGFEAKSPNEYVAMRSGQFGSQANVPKQQIDMRSRHFNSKANSPREQMSLQERFAAIKASSSSNKNSSAKLSTN